MDIKLINAEDERKDLEERVKCYDSTHKTKEYIAIGIALENLKGKLDPLELQGDENYCKRRTELYAQIKNLEADLLGKIHKDPKESPPCEICIHVKVSEVRLGK